MHGLLSQKHHVPQTGAGHGSQIAIQPLLSVVAVLLSDDRLDILGRDCHDLELLVVPGISCRRCGKTEQFGVSVVSETDCTLEFVLQFLQSFFRSCLFSHFTSSLDL